MDRPEIPAHKSKIGDDRQQDAQRHGIGAHRSLHALIGLFNAIQKSAVLITKNVSASCLLISLTARFLRQFVLKIQSTDFIHTVQQILQYDGSAQKQQCRPHSLKTDAPDGLFRRFEKDLFA